jgi:selenide,water dikinase
MTKRLTEFSKSSGCGCKIQPAVLQQMLHGMTLQAGATPGLVHGNAGGDDCSVFDLGGGQLLLQTVDFLRRYWMILSISVGLLLPMR